MKKMFTLFVATIMLLSLAFAPIQSVAAAVDYSDLVLSYDMITGEIAYHSMNDSVIAYRAENNLSARTPMISHPSAPPTDDTVVTEIPIDIQPFAGIPDNRIKVNNTGTFPYGVVVYIQHADGAHGTGFMISNQCVLTAGHVLYNTATDKWYENIKIYPASTGLSGPYYTAKKVWASSNYTSQTNTFDDWGMIELSTNASIGYFGLADSANKTDSFQTSGFPGDKNGELWKCDGKISTINIDYLETNHYSSGGQSGSPLYNSGNYAVGVLSVGAIWNDTILFYTVFTRLGQSTINWLIANKY